MQHWCLAVDRVRYVGEPVAVALARDRRIAEDALERIAVRYRPLPPVVDAEKAAEPDAPLLHPEVGSTIVSDRAFRYGDPEAVFSGLSVAQNNSAACNIPGRNTAAVGNRATARNTHSRRVAPPSGLGAARRRSPSR